MTRHQTDALDLIAKIIAQDGPEPHQHAQLTWLFDRIQKGLQNNDKELHDLLGRLQKERVFYDPSSVIGHCLAKPYGYAGDFSIIDRIYNYAKSEKYQKWDEYALNLDAAQAVRNRKAYFKKSATERMQSGGHLLNVASGPARDLLELYASSDYSDLFTTCVEMDPHAIAHAKKLNESFQDRISYINKNIFRFKPDRQFDWIWSAGLFDYFDDKAFVLLLKRFKTWLKPGGEIIIGNFNADCNPSKAVMELAADWYLIHRTEASLIHLALQAGFAMEQISVGKEELGVNLFLHISYPCNN